MPPVSRRQEPAKRRITETQIVAPSQTSQPDQTNEPAEQRLPEQQASSPRLLSAASHSPPQGCHWLHNLTWQGILQKNKRAFGRLGCFQRLDLLSLSSERGGGAAVVGLVWCSVLDKQQAPLSVLVDAEFCASEFSLKVFCSSASASASFSGSEVSQAISQHRQRQDYIKRAACNFTAAKEQQVGSNSGPAGPAAARTAPEEYLFERGDALSSYGLAFDVSRSVAQLTRVEFKLAVVHTSSPLDEPSVLLSNSTSSSDRADPSSRNLAACGSSQTLPGQGSHSSLLPGRAAPTAQISNLDASVKRVPTQPPGPHEGLQGSASTLTHTGPNEQHVTNMQAAPAAMQHSDRAPHEGQYASSPATAAQNAASLAQTQPSPPAKYLHPHHKDHPDQLQPGAGAAEVGQNGILPHDSPSSRVTKLNSTPVAGTGLPVLEQPHASPKNGKVPPHSPLPVQLYQNGRTGGKTIAVPSSNFLNERLSNGHANGACPPPRSFGGSGQPSPVHTSLSAWDAVPAASSAAPVTTGAGNAGNAGNVGNSSTLPGGMAVGSTLHRAGSREEQPAWHQAASGAGEAHEHRQQRQGDAFGSEPHAAGHPPAAYGGSSGSRVVGTVPPRSQSPWGPQGRRSTSVSGAGRSASGSYSAAASPVAVPPGFVPTLPLQDTDAEGGAGAAARPAAVPPPARSAWDVSSPTASSVLAGQQGPPPAPPPPQQQLQQPPPQQQQQPQQQPQQPQQPQPQPQQQQQPPNAWVSGAPGAVASSSSTSSYHATAGRPRSKQQQPQQMGGTAGGGRHGGGGSSAAKQGGAWAGGARGASGGASAATRHGGGGMSSRGSSPALPTYRDQSDTGSGVERSTTPGCSTPPEPASTADLERFILQVTPMLSLDASQPLDQALQNLSLDDVWRFYLEPSLYGREVYTLGGLRGPSLCYFVPYLSAIQLFTPASPKDGPGTSRMYVSDTEGWPKHMHLKFEHFEHEMPFNRTPLYEHIEQLAESSSQEQQREREKEKERLLQQQERQQDKLQQLQQQQDKLEKQHQDRQDKLHREQQDRQGGAGAAGPEGELGVGGEEGEASPRASRSASGSGAGSSPSEAPAVRMSSASSSTGLPRPAGATPPPTPSPPPGQQLPSSFLREARIADLHPASWFSVAWYPVYRIPDAPLCARFLTFHSFAPIVISMQRAHAALVEEGLHRPVAIMPLQVVGLKWYNMQGERWLDALTDPAVGPGNQQPSSSRRQQQFANDGGWPGESGAGGGRHQRRQPAPQMDAAWQSHLGELQVTAERLARGYGLRVLGQMGAEDVKLRHPDYEFFNTRS